MRLTQDQFVGSCLTATLAKDDSPLVEVGFLRDTNGTLYCENVFEHDVKALSEDVIISEPSKLSYTLTLNDTTHIHMKHECIFIGTSTILSRLVVEDSSIGMFAAGDSIHAKLKIFKENGKFLKTVYSGRFVVPERMHPLGHPNGPEGFMVQIFPKNMMFVQPKRGRLTFQINLCDYNEE